MATSKRIDMPALQPDHAECVSRRHVVRWLALVGAILIGLAAPLGAARAQQQAGDTPNIAAASDLKFALEEIAAQFRKDIGQEVNLAFGSSGNFFRQISEGAPFQMFLSADESF